MPRTYEEALAQFSETDRAEVEAEGAALVAEYVKQQATMREAIEKATQYLIEAQRLFTASGAPVIVAISTATQHVEVGKIDEGQLRRILEAAD